MTSYATEYRVTARTTSGDEIAWTSFDRAEVDAEIAEMISLGAPADAFRVDHRTVTFGPWAPTTLAPAQVR